MNYVANSRRAALAAAGVALTVATASQVFVLTDAATAATTPLSQAQQVVPAQAAAGVQSRVAAANKALATANRIYKTGRLANVACSPGTLPSGSTNAYRRFLTRVTDCLNRAWGAQFRKAKMPFAKPRLRIITSKVNTPCGKWNVGAQGVYCSSNRTMYMLISKEQLRQPFPLAITRLVAHEYGHHVQQISKIWTYYWQARSTAGRSQSLQLSRNSELQAECFSAVFMSTLRGGSLFTEEEWDYTVDWFRKNGAKAWPQNDHGKGPTQAAWMTRGYNSGAPGSCNTWAASPRTTT
ncbi:MULTISPECIES: neutral zinc metallopeptidase [unclassified Nonomuraea]|uniref:neutral zinc metallopeptidase n=1 Tax=unclassified Nonomuraea TaxID=2593643 RepID=UPI0035C1C359